MNLGFWESQTICARTVHCEHCFLLHQFIHEPCVSRMILFGEAKIYPLLSILNTNIKCFVFEFFWIFTNISPVHFSSFEHCEHSLANVERMPPVVVFHLFCWNIFYNLGKFIFGYFCIQHNEYYIITWQMSNTMQHKCKYKYLYL